jgi:hypothetical protein
MIEDEIVDTIWTDRDTDLIVQCIMDKKLGLEDVDELSQ